MLYRIIQEQLNNVLKHSKADHVQIVLQDMNGGVHLTIHDNGVGFDIGEVKHGMGLNNIRSRLQLVNGMMQIQSEPGRGCTLDIDFSV